MPNWANNKITITGDRLHDFVSKATSNTLDKDKFRFNNIVAMPEKFSDEGWYEWRLNNWGTKWDIEDQMYTWEYNQEDKTLEMEFTTAWSPPIPFFVKASELFDLNFTLRFFEEGMCFMGEVEVEDGEVRSWEADITNEDYVVAGAVLEEDGSGVDWELSDDYDMWKAFEVKI